MTTTRRKSATPAKPDVVPAETPELEPLPELEQIRIGLDRLLAEVKALREEIG